MYIFATKWATWDGTFNLTKPSVSCQDPDVFRYHVLLNELLFPDDLSDGTLKSTVLGSDYQVHFHIDKNNQVTSQSKRHRNELRSVAVRRKGNLSIN